MEIAARASLRGARVVEAPVTGSVQCALNGTLNFFAGGDDETIDSVKQFLQSLGKNVYHMGPIGAGNTAKLALNILVATMAFGLRESIAMLNAANLDAVKFLDALANSGLASPLYQRIGQRYLERDFAARFSLSNLEKDMKLARDLSQTLALPATLATLLTSHLEKIEEGVKYNDYSMWLYL